MAEIWEAEAPGSWKVPNKPKIVFPVQSVRPSGGLRLQKRERPYRPGAKLDTTGPQARTYSVVIPIENSIDEPGISQPIYPETLDTLIDALESDDTGDLILPMRGTIRAKCETWDFEESPENQDAAILNVTWVEDNEDDVDQQAFESKTANANARRLAEVTEFDEQREGVWDGSIAQLNEFVSEIEGIANMPGQTAQDIITRLRIIRRQARRLETVFSDEAQDSRALLLEPDRHTVIRKLREIQDLAGRQEAESLKGRPRTVEYVVNRDRSLQSIANELGQSYEDLVELNQWRIEDPLLVEEASVIRVFEVRP